MHSRKFFSFTFPGIKVRMIRLQFLRGPSCLSWHRSSKGSSGTSPSHNDIAKDNQWRSMTSARSLSSQGCMSNVLECCLAWASSTEGKFSLFQTFPLGFPKANFTGWVWSKNIGCPLLLFLLFRMVPSWAWRRWSLNMTQLSWTHCLSRAMSYGILPSSSLRLKSAIKKSRATCCPAPSSQSPELHHLTVL